MKITDVSQFKDGHIYEELRNGKSRFYYAERSSAYYVNLKEVNTNHIPWSVNNYVVELVEIREVKTPNTSPNNTDIERIIKW